MMKNNTIFAVAKGQRDYYHLRSKSKGRFHRTRIMQSDFISLKADGIPLLDMDPVDVENNFFTDCFYLSEILLRVPGQHTLCLHKDVSINDSWHVNVSWPIGKLFSIVVKDQEGDILAFPCFYPENYKNIPLVEYESTFVGNGRSLESGLALSDLLVGLEQGNTLVEVEVSLEGWDKHQIFHVLATTENSEDSWGIGDNLYVKDIKAVRGCPLSSVTVVNKKVY